MRRPKVLVHDDVVELSLQVALQAGNVTVRAGMHHFTLKQGGQEEEGRGGRGHAKGTYEKEGRRKMIYVYI